MKNLSYFTLKEKCDLLETLATRLVITFYACREEEPITVFHIEEENIQLSLSSLMKSEVHLFCLGGYYMAYVGEVEGKSGVGMKFTSEEVLDRVGPALLHYRWNQHQKEG